MKTLPVKKASVVEKRMAIIFNEWNKRYSENPSEFVEQLDENGEPIEDYGRLCAIYFTELAEELDKANKLPKLSA